MIAYSPLVNRLIERNWIMSEIRMEWESKWRTGSPLGTGQKSGKFMKMPKRILAMPWSIRSVEVKVHDPV
jgi:hypothetical protein